MFFYLPLVKLVRFDLFYYTLPGWRQLVIIYSTIVRARIYRFDLF